MKSFDHAESSEEPSLKPEQAESVQHKSISPGGRSASDAAEEVDTEGTAGAIRKKPEPCLAETQPGGDVPLIATDQSPGVLAPVAKWEKYEIQKLLGRGGMGAVYQARDLRLNRKVALKFIRGDDPLLAKRFLQEARSQARLDHPNLCRIYEVGQVEDKPYIAMQFIDGQSLDQANAELSLHEKIIVIRDAALALHEAHRIGVIHRDIKPANILVQRRSDGLPQPIVMDFGLARESNTNRGLTETGTVMGTPGYMPPEQARGSSRHLDRRADVYSLGATLYELLAGQPPFTGQEVIDVILSVLNDEPQSLRALVPEVPVDLETIVLKCLAKEPVQRYDSAKALADDLQRFIDGDAIQGRRSSLRYRLARQVRRNRALFALGTITVLVAAILGALGLRIELRSRRQAALSQLLGQEIRDMEWLLRSARQLPLHDLEREKTIIRRRMGQLQTELVTYGELSRGLAHYALGRGHLALHEYPLALAQLRQAIALGVQSAEVNYALGFVLGKHFEQAMYEARLAGGGDWAKKQLKDIEPQYLVPAIDLLSRSREMKHDSPHYLDGLIAYYQRDYENALTQTAAALQSAPWLYEAAKLSGDVHHERALLARDVGHDEKAKQEFAAAVKSYEAAATIGPSDSEVYAALAETWVRQIEMAAQRGQPTHAAHAAAIAASEKVIASEPQSITGPLQKARASMMTMVVAGEGLSSEVRIRECLAAAEQVLEKQPGHPYASETAANCELSAAEGLRALGKDPEPLLRKALSRLVPILKIYPHFLHGRSGLGAAYILLGSNLQLHGSANAKDVLEKSVEQFVAALSIDAAFLNAPINVLATGTFLVLEAQSDADIRAVLSLADEWLAKCKAIDSNNLQCLGNYFQVYARAANWALQAGQDPLPWLQRASEMLAMHRRSGGNFLDTEQHAALAQFVEASDRVRRNLDPWPSLIEMQASLKRCFAIAKEDAMCRTLSVRAEWVQADWLTAQHKPAVARLEAALAEAHLATQSPEIYPDAWDVLAQAHLRLAQVANGPAARVPHIHAGLAAVEKVFAVNPNHASGLATRGALELLRAQGQLEPSERHSAAQSAVRALERALQRAPLLLQSYAPMLETARRITQQTE